MLRIETFRTTLEKIIKILQLHGISYHLTGGVTSIAYSEPRMTQDVDIVVRNETISKCLNSFLEALRASEFLFDESAIRLAVDKRQVFQLLDSVEALKLDIYPREL